MELTFDDVCLLSNLLSELFSVNTVCLLINNPSSNLAVFLNKDNTIALQEIQSRLINEGGAS